MARISRNDGHSHTFTSKSKFTSTVDGHKHSVRIKNGKVTIGRADGHTHSGKITNARKSKKEKASS